MNLKLQIKYVGNWSGYASSFKNLTTSLVNLEKIIATSMLVKDIHKNTILDTVINWSRTYFSGLVLKVWFEE